MFKRMLSIFIVAASCLSSAPDALTRELIYSGHEEVLIDRNEVLSKMRREDPESLRQILDLIASPPAAPNPPRPTAKPRIMPFPQREEPAFDPTENPDLVLLQRSSPEAVYELLQILKRVGAGKGQR